MYAATYQFLAEDHLRALHREAGPSRVVALARETSKAPSDGRTSHSGLRFEVVRRLVARLTAAA